MIVHVNGQPFEIEPGTTVARVVEELRPGGGRRGIAVAIDAEVVPRGQWDDRVLDAEARLEVVNAIQGG